MQLDPKIQLGSLSKTKHSIHNSANMVLDPFPSKSLCVGRSLDGLGSRRCPRGRPASLLTRPPAPVVDQRLSYWGRLWDGGLL